MTSGELSALSLITSTREFSGTEQRIVDYILDHREEAPTMTAAQLARRSGTSEATISRSTTTAASSSRWAATSRSSTTGLTSMARYRSTT